MKQVIKSIHNLFDLAGFNLKNNSWCKQKGIHGAYFEGLMGEIEEAKAEFKKDNAVYFEDELGDIFWDYIMLLNVLERDGYIRSAESVFKHAEEKFSERLQALRPEHKNDPHYLWDAVKLRQKKRLKQSGDVYIAVSN